LFNVRRINAKRGGYQNYQLNPGYAPDKCVFLCPQKHRKPPRAGVFCSLTIWDGGVHGIVNTEIGNVGYENRCYECGVHTDNSHTTLTLLNDTIILPIPIVGGKGEKMSCNKCHTCGNKLRTVLDGEEWCDTCQTYRRYASHGWNCESADKENRECLSTVEGAK